MCLCGKLKELRTRDCSSFSRIFPRIIIFDPTQLTHEETLCNDRPQYDAEWPGQWNLSGYQQEENFKLPLSYHMHVNTAEAILGNQFRRFLGGTDEHHVRSVVFSSFQPVLP